MMLMLSGIGSMSLFVLLLLGVLAVPVMLVSTVANWMEKCTIPNVKI